MFTRHRARRPPRSDASIVALIPGQTGRQETDDVIAATSQIVNSHRRRYRSIRPRTVDVGYCRASQATTTYRFYEELDFWLGPWGQNGYPIAYGKFYNVLFTTNPKLDSNAQARQWVWQTTIFLQEALRDFAVSTVRDGSIRTLTEARLRQAAFDSHPSAYDRGGLAMVALTAPEMIRVIATIPSANSCQPPTTSAQQ